MRTRSWLPLLTLLAACEVTGGDDDKTDSPADTDRDTDTDTDADADADTDTPTGDGNLALEGPRAAQPRPAAPPHQEVRPQLRVWFSS